MKLLSENIGILVACGLLTLIAAFITVVLSVICGTTLAYYARPNMRYGAMLAILFVPFAVGGSIWAYSMTRFASWCGLQSEIVESNTITRACVLLLLCLGRSVPLGVFFCATSLHRYTAEIRSYFYTHQLKLPFFLLCGINRIPKSILMLLGLFGGALMASEASLPLFLYRANPGTEPETTNIMLSRLFREIYASVGPDSISQIANFGLIVSLFSLLTALCGTWAGRGFILFIRSLLKRSNIFNGIVVKMVTMMLCATIGLVLLPGVLALVSLLIPGQTISFTSDNVIETAISYRDIVVMGILVAVTISTLGVAIAIRLRYSKVDLLSMLEKNSLAACVLLLPAFTPVLSIVAALGWVLGGQMTGLSGYFSLYTSHSALHFPIFQFICMTLIMAIPERHVAWQRTMKLRYMFSLYVDGFKRHRAVIISLIGLGTVQVITDGSISRWFAHLVKAPEEALYAAVFGRLSNASEAAIVAWSTAFVAILICSVLATAYIRELKNQSKI